MTDKKELAEQILKKCGGVTLNDGYIEVDRERVIAAIIEAMGEKPEIPSNIEELAAKAIPNHPYPDMNYPGDAVTKISRKSWIEGYKEAMGVQSGMRWVKASERNPTKSGYYFTYRGHWKSYPQTTFWYNDEQQWSSETVEWLEETPQLLNNEQNVQVSDDNNKSV